MTEEGSAVGSSPTEPPPLPGPESGPSARTARYLAAWFRRFAKLWGFAAFCVFVVYVFRDVALPFVFAILVAYVLAPLVDRLARVRVAGRNLPRGLAVILIYVNILALLGLFVGYFIPKLSGDFARLFREAPQLFERVNEEWLPKAGAWVDQHLGAGVRSPSELLPGPASPRRAEILVEPLANGKFRVDLSGAVLDIQPGPNGSFHISPPVDDESEVAPGEGKWERSIKQWMSERLKSTESESRRALEYGQRFVTAVIAGIARLVLVLMVGAFILIDLERIRAFIRSLVPDTHRSDYDVIVNGIDRGLSGVIRGQLLICCINGVLTYVGLGLLHVKYPLLLAGVAGVMSLVPVFGSIFSSIPIVVVALVSSGSFDLAPAVYMLGWIVLIHLLEANYLNPKIMGGAAKIHPVLVVFALIAGEHSYGLVGALFAVPAASIVQTIFVYYRRRGFLRVAPGA